MSEAATLQAEIDRLSAELEKQKLQEQIRALESQLKQDEDLSEEEEYEEEIIEESEYSEYEEEIIEEVLEDEEESPVNSSTTRKGEAPGGTPSWSISHAPQEAKTTQKPISEASDSTANSSADKNAPKKKKVVIRKVVKKKSAVSSDKPKGAPEEAPKSKGWMPFAKRDPKAKPKYPHPDDPVKTTTKQVPVIYKPRQLPNLQASPEGEETRMEALLGPKLYKDVKFTKVNTRAVMDQQELTLFYFAAGWRKECKAFTPQLIDFYRAVTNQSNIEVVYFSLDRTLFEFKQVYQAMPWPAMPTKTASLKNYIAQQLKVQDLPTLVVLETETGLVKTVKGVEDVESVQKKLELRQREDAYALVEEWKQKPGMGFDKIKLDKRLKNGNQQQGIVYWQE